MSCVGQFLCVSLETVYNAYRFCSLFNAFHQNDLMLVLVEFVNVFIVHVFVSGKYCERCVEGYYGDASNGGNCTGE